MKKGYKRLILFSALLMTILLVNTFVYKIFSSYGIILFLMILIPIFDVFFVIEKDHHRYLNDILFEILMYVISFFLLYYLLGFVVGLVKIPNYYTFEGLKNFILPITLYCTLREILRYNMLCKTEGSRISVLVVLALFIFLDMTNSFYYASLTSKYEILKFVSLTLLPVFAKNASYSYVSVKMGYRPVILFDLIFSLYPYLIPILPNPNEYLTAIISLLVPILFAFRLLHFFDKREDHFLPSNYYKKRFKSSLLPIGIILMIVYFYSGYFRFYAVAIASGSMEPKIKKGDVVIVDQKYSYKELEEGEIIAFRKDDVILVHRIAKKMKLDNSYIYYTKGDANSHMDTFIIYPDMVIGKIRYKLSYIGYPTVWFSER